MQNNLSKKKAYTKAIMKAHLVSCDIDYKDMDKPIIAIANSWNEILPGHFHFRTLADEVKRGIIDAGGLPLEFNTIAICDGIAQGHNGMKYSLPSRELIADSVEVMVNGHGIFDGIVALSACDKIVPAMLMSLGRINIPSLVVLGGVMPNYITPKENKQARQAFLANKIDEKELVRISKLYYPSAGACPFLGTANTMQGLAEALGMALPNSAWERALSKTQLENAYQSGLQVVNLVKQNVKPKDIMTQIAFENAISVLLAMGGSLNACIHLPAIANEVGIKISSKLFDKISRKVPFIASVTPNNNDFTTNDLHNAGGIPAIMKELEEVLNLDALTVTLKSHKENLKDAKVHDRNIIYPINNPINKEGGIALLEGNIARNGAFIKQSAVSKELLTFTGNARVFDSEELFLIAFENNEIKEYDAIVIRYEGPKGGPGMRELHRCTEVISKFENIALITDGRFSGATSGLSIGYLSPEAAEGGEISLLQDGDIIEIDIPNRSLNVKVSEKELLSRKILWPQSKNYNSNFLGHYASSTLSAADGAIKKDYIGCKSNCCQKSKNNYDDSEEWGFPEQ